MVYQVSYELKGHRSRQAYETLANAIKGISGQWCHVPESKYYIETDLSTRQVLDIIAPYTVVGDMLQVIRVYRDWSAYGLNPDQINWLNAKDFSSPGERVPMSLLGSLLGQHPYGYSDALRALGADFRP